MILFIVSAFSFFGRADNLGLTISLIGLIYIQKHQEHVNYGVFWWIIMASIALDLFWIYHHHDLNAKRIAPDVERFYGPEFELKKFAYTMSAIGLIVKLFAQYLSITIYMNEQKVKYEAMQTVIEE